MPPVLNGMHVTQERAKSLERDPAYRGVLHAFAAVHLLSLFVSCQVAGTHDLHPLALTGAPLLVKWVMFNNEPQAGN